MRKLACLLSLLPLCTVAQNVEPSTTYPQNYFRNPLDIPIFLAGNFGECRPGHFHSGVDIKTEGKENLPVHAAADGYISRIKMEKGGFGHALYITHSNGYTTLYAHLNDFAPAIQKFLRKEQYGRKKWDIDITFTPVTFPVKKGQLIAYSGNTGASTAPHVHFEIRNTKTEHPLNPELFNLPIKDNTAPVMGELVFYNGNIYGNGQRVAVALAKKGDVYKPVRTDNAAYNIVRDTVYVPGPVVGVGVNADDYMEGSSNTLAFYTASLYMDDAVQSRVTLDDIGYDETRYINAYTDFKTRQLQKKWVQCLFIQPGNRLDRIYSSTNDQYGRLNVGTGKAHKLTLKITDDKDNTSTASFYIAGKPAEEKPSSGCTPFYANKVNNFDDPNVTFALDERQLYDDVCFSFRRVLSGTAYSDKYQLHYPYVPVHHYFDLYIKPGKNIPIDMRDKVVMMYSDDKDEDGRAAVFSDKGWYRAPVRNFGTYWLDIDTTAPQIKPTQKNNANLSKAKQILFEVRDAKTSVRSFSGLIDDKWVCFEQHANKFFYNFDEHCEKGKHKLVFKAADENGNEAVYEMSFVR
jgi:hypothetical protein